MKNKIITVLIVIIVFIPLCLLLAYIPQIKKANRIAGYQEQIAKNKEQRAICEQLMMSGHAENDELRNKLNKELGLQTETQAPQRTGTQAPVLTGSIIE